VKYLKELYKTDSKGKTRHWRIWVEGNVIKTEHGVYEGTLVEASKTIKKGKNIGKANETTPKEQALSEALSTIKKKYDKNYGDTPGHTDIKILPMLAHDFRKREKAIEYPCYVQPKLDGIRCFAYIAGTLNVDGLEVYDIELMSRGGKLFTQPFEDLRLQISENIQIGEIWDGELCTDKLTFEQICAAVKKEDYRETSELIEFHLFDIFVPGFDEPFTERFVRLVNIAMQPQSDFGDRIKVVDTLAIDSKEEAMEFYSQCMTKDYEGIIFRNFDGVYKPGARSKDLQKYKEFLDEEFTIVSAFEGTGTDEGTVIWVCETKSGDTFRVRPRGTVAQRKEWWENWQQYEHQLLTVRYQNLTEDGIPRFPVGVAIRDYE